MDAADLTWITSLGHAIETVVAYLLDRTRFTLMEPFYTGSRLFLGYLAGALLLAVVSFRLYHARSGGEGEGRGGWLKRFFAFCFPGEVWGHPSAILDYKIALANRFLIPAISFTSIASTTAVAVWVSKTLTAHLGAFPFSLPWNLWSIAATSLVFILLADLLEYGLHWAQHNVPLLWRMHRVHHSAETLTPVTLFREHPFLDVFFNVPVRAVVFGGMSGALFYVFFQGEHTAVVLAPVLTFNFLFDFLGSNLRHSHVWLSYGWIANHVFISPAMHQIHHSVAPEHLYKNLGVKLAFWDWLFGTLYVPRQREQITFGLEAGMPQVHPTLWRAYLEPFIGGSPEASPAPEGEVARSG